MEHHGYASIDIALVNSTSLFPGGARREEIELTLVSYSKLQTFHAISVKGIQLTSHQEARGVHTDRLII